VHRDTGGVKIARRSPHTRGQNCMPVHSRAGRYVLFIGGELIVKNLSRKREYYADAIGASLTSPDAMIRALEKLERLGRNETAAEECYGHLMFKGVGFGHVFSTHPTTEDRCRALRSGTYLEKLTEGGVLQQGARAVTAWAIRTAPHRRYAWRVARREARGGARVVRAYIQAQRMARGEQARMLRATWRSRAQSQRRTQSPIRFVLLTLGVASVGVAIGFGVTTWVLQ
ncbi:MAG: M48 family metalloprotease, partial [Nitrospiraceae bacterium]